VPGDFLARDFVYRVKGSEMFVLRAVGLLAPLLLSFVATAQTGVTVAGFGYRTPDDVVTAAPGQVMVVSVYGAVARIAEPIFPVATVDGLPTTVGGFSVDFVQGLLTVQLAIRALQQTPCPASGTCSPATSLTIQIPFELNPDSITRATLRFKEADKVFATAQLNGVTDSVHILNTCDQTGVYLSIAVGTPPSVCTSMVMHARGPLVSSSAPAVPGETLVAWAYGLGAPAHPQTEPCCASPDQIPPTAHPVNVSLSYTDATGYPQRRLAEMPASWAGMVGSGLYQVQFVVPPSPPDLGRCGVGTGNVRVLVSGPTSADSAVICAQP
jgi:uncharacterized protein (TIGR03437 family)